MLNSKKNVFWEALLLTVVVFIFGLLIGVAYEQSHLTQINSYYAESELSMMDILAMNSAVSFDGASCESLVEANTDFADRIYTEAKDLEKYQAAGKITESGFDVAHKKYDLMRTFLWINSIKTFEKCNDSSNVVVYIYEYNSEDLTKKATQNVWSKILYDLKLEEGSNVILIPIAYNGDFVSLDSLVNNFEIESYPVVIINNKQIISELSSVSEIQKHLN